MPYIQPWFTDSELFPLHQFRRTRGEDTEITSTAASLIIDRVIAYTPHHAKPVAERR